MNKHDLVSAVTSISGTNKANAARVVDAVMKFPATVARMGRRHRFDNGSIGTFVLVSCWRTARFSIHGHRVKRYAEIECRKRGSN